MHPKSMPLDIDVDASHTSESAQPDWKTRWCPTPLIGAINLLKLGISIFFLGVLVVLGMRAFLVLPNRWDEWMYHIPFAARYSGIDVPYELNERMTLYWQGFPHLPQFVQGQFWRFTGTVNGIGLSTYSAFLVFLGYCHFALKARFWCVSLIALTTPMVLIHAASGYVDLFANAFLAVGVVTLAHGYMIDEFKRTDLMIWGVLGLVCAAWSKIQLMPIVVMFLALYIFCYGFGSHRPQPEIRRLRWILGLACAMALLPYMKNMLVHGNPFWPMKLPLVGDLFPYALDTRSEGLLQRPVHLDEHSQPLVFFHSLFEIGHPVEYDHRRRWVLDQGNATVSFRCGGFWAVHVLLSLGTLVLFAWQHPKKKRWGLLAAALLTILFVSVLPQSHELRYYQFLPLSWAAIIALLVPRVERLKPELLLIVMLILCAAYRQVTPYNYSYYSTNPRNYQETARQWLMDRYWAQMYSGYTYCAINMVPVGIVLTGPTFTEFDVVDRIDSAYCPKDSIPIQFKPDTEVEMFFPIFFPSMWMPKAHPTGASDTTDPFTH